MHVNMVVYLMEKLNQLLHKKRLLHKREVFIRFFHSYRELYPFIAQKVTTLVLKENKE